MAGSPGTSTTPTTRCASYDEAELLVPRAGDPLHGKLDGPFTAIDLARMAGLYPAGVLCEIVDEKTRAQLQQFLGGFIASIEAAT